MRVFAAAIFACTLLASAPPAAPPAAPVPEALLDRLMASLPPDEQPMSDFPEIATLTARLTAANPGREAEAKSIVKQLADCLDPIVRAEVAANQRAAAASLGAAKVRRLIALYTGPDYRIGMRVLGRSHRGLPLTAADRETEDRILRTYPARDWMDATARARQLSYSRPQFQARTGACQSATREALARAGLHLP